MRKNKKMNKMNQLGCLNCIKIIFKLISRNYTILEIAVRRIGRSQSRIALSRTRELDNGVAINGTIALHESRLMQDKLRNNFMFIVAKSEYRKAWKILDKKGRRTGHN